MFHLVAKIFLVLSFIAFLVSARNFAESKDAIQGLDLEKYSEKQVKDCYYYNNTLGICFDVQQHSMRLLKTTGETFLLTKIFIRTLSSTKYWIRHFSGMKATVLDEIVEKSFSNLLDELNV